MYTRQVALIIFYDEEKRILLQDRRGISKVGEEWGFFGGEIEEGESAEGAVIRETEEELRIRLEDPHFLDIFVGHVPSRDLVVEAHVFLTRLPKPVSEIQQEEGEHMQLFSIEEAKKLKMVSEVDKKVLDAVERELLL